MSQAIKPRTKKALGEVLAELSNPRPDTFDPESHGEDGLGGVNSDSDADDADFGYEKDVETGREHYVRVGRGRIRDAIGVNLEDEKYAGKRVGRSELGFDEEDDEGEEEEGMEVDQSGDELEGDDDGDESDGDSHSENDGDGDEDEDGSDEEEEQERADQIAADLKRMAEKEKELLRNVANNTSADAEKGNHVKAQMVCNCPPLQGCYSSSWLTTNPFQVIYESLLDLRIQMQPALLAANRLPVGDESYEAFTTAGDILPKNAVASTTQAIETASAALRSLISDLIDTRAHLIAKNDAVSLSPPDFATAHLKKRKRSNDDDDEVNFDALWTQVREMDNAFEAFRDGTIEKWSNKVMASSLAASAQQDKKFKAINQSALVQIRGILNDKERLVKRTRLVRTGAGEASRRFGFVERREEAVRAKDEEDDGEEDAKPKTEREEIEELEEKEQLRRRAGRGLDSHLSNFDEEVFDDGDFYQQQLKELIEGRLLETGKLLIFCIAPYDAEKRVIHQTIHFF
ncbi:apoptosis antagonizing transcription factor-domain-containing protein [Chytriomyces sp. MP71]|nr:apoptosis antagonizing transcription factor-domain-containing protein [Chytriomyces sp. MP71]